ncbi:MAG: AAA family ATPase, partial [Rhodoplanes sp.]
MLLDIIGITDFWATTALGFLNSLHQPVPSGRTQYEAVLSAIVSRVPLDSAARKAMNEWEEKPDKTRLDTVELFLRLMRRVDQTNTTKHQDVIRALLLLGSDDWDANNIAYCWLQGLDVDESKRHELGFLKAPPPYHELVRGMLWVMSLAGPTLIAVDQIDSIVSASNLLAGLDGAPADDTERKARAIIELLAGGLMDLHDLKRRAMTVVSCLQVTWPIIKARAVQAAAQRFEELPVLEPIKSRDIVENLINGRLDSAYAEMGFHPPYRTWPFRPDAIESAVGLLPRQILIRCNEHRQRCIAAGEVLECTSLGEARTPPPPPPPPPGLEQEFQRQFVGADISGLLEKENEDTVASDLLIHACELLLRHLVLPDTIDAVVKPDPDRKKPSLHGRLSFTFHKEGDREQHYCFRILGHTNAIAFQSRLKAAMTASGIDTALKFRHLFILRRADPPGGPKTKAKALVDQFLKAGGKFIAPADDDLRAFVALRAMAKCDLPGFDSWLREEKPLFKTHMFNEAGLCPPWFLLSAPPPEPPPEPSPPSQPQSSPSERLIPIGRRYERGALGAPVILPADLLPRHVAILAGPGSGKTVLLRRITEEATLLGIP